MASDACLGRAHYHVDEALDGVRGPGIYCGVFKPGEKVIVTQYDGKTFHGVVVVTEVFAAGNKVRVRSGPFVLNVDEKLVAKDD